MVQFIQAYQTMRRRHMSRKVNITCRYYWVKSYTEEGTSEDKYDLLEWFDKISDMTLAELTQQVGQVKGDLMKLLKGGRFML